MIDETGNMAVIYTISKANGRHRPRISNYLGQGHGKTTLVPVKGSYCFDSAKYIFVSSDN